MKKILSLVMSFVLIVTFAVTPALAHVVVKPGEVGVGAFQTFTVGVPNEKDNATTQVRLVLPEGLEHVSPNVKPGWTIEVQRGEGEEAPATEIIWSGGTIPQGQRDDFYFSAKVPAQEATLTWKAYQTYEDGTVVSWDGTDGHDADYEENAGPASETRVINDLTEADSQQEQTAGENNLPLMLSIVAIALSGGALYQARQRK